MQLPLYDVKEALILPWKQQEMFHKGTFVMAKAHLNAHHFLGSGSGRGTTYSVSIRFTSQL